jgi:hypothetical protein
MKVAILIPSTTRNREWFCITDTYLWNSIVSFVNKGISDYQYKFYIGVDKDDRIYSDKAQRKKLYDLVSTWSNVNIQFYPIDRDEHKGYLSYIWNHLYEKAIQENNDYFYIAGDDIMYLDNGWLEACITNLKSTKDIGAAGCFNGNTQILTQFLVSKKHYEIFKFAYNPKIKNWYVDNHLHELYSPSFLHISKHRCINAGGLPRYEIDHTAKDFYKDLVVEDREKLFSWIKLNGGLKHYLKKTRGKKTD